MEVDIDELGRANAELARELATKAQGSPCVLLVRGDSYAEVIRKEGDDLAVAFWSRFTHISSADAEAQGYKATPAGRIIKANGTVMYWATTPAGTDWYVAGKRYPAVEKRRLR